MLHSFNMRTKKLSKYATVRELDAVPEAPIHNCQKKKVSQGKKNGKSC